MRILLSGLVTPAYLKFLQRHLYNGDKLTCLITNPSPLFNIKVPFIFPPTRNTSKIQYELPENYKVAARNKEIFIYFMTMSTGSRLHNHLDGLEIYFSNLPENLQKNIKIVYEYDEEMTFKSQNFMNVKSPEVISLENFIKKHQVGCTVIHIPQNRQRLSYFSLTPYLFNSYRFQDFSSSFEDNQLFLKEKFEERRLKEPLSCSELLDHIINDQTTLNKSVTFLE